MCSILYSFKRTAGCFIVKDMRPTSGKVLLAMFNVLGPLHGKKFLDLFAGSGQVAMEALRRGADAVCAVEADKRRYAEMSARLPGGIDALCMDVRRALPRFVKKCETFDIIFADPPYNLGWGKEFPALMEENSGVLASGGIIVLEHSARESIKEMNPEVWERRERAYGGTVLSIFGRRSETDD